MKPTKFQTCVQRKLSQGNSLLLIAPTGLGKTFAVVGDLQDHFCKTVYTVPLRALGTGIRQEVCDLRRGGSPVQAVIHHGGVQESMLFGEEVIVTTYDQVVCATPGLPLSLPLKAGHAVAGALLMSRLVLDEAHLAWGISDQALSILLAIVEFRVKLGLQTVVLTATMPKDVAGRICNSMNGLDLCIVGEGDMSEDEGLQLRETNRNVTVSTLELKTKGKGDSKQLDFMPLDDLLRGPSGKRIYFANTVKRIQGTFDRMLKLGIDPTKVTVLHNRMPGSWRAAAEDEVRQRFGKGSPDGDWLLLTNQVAEAGLDISAPLVVSDPAPVDTLVQRSGRCARWFRHGPTDGVFRVIQVPATQFKEWAAPYRGSYVGAAMKMIPGGHQLSWDNERKWVEDTWGGEPEKAQQAVEQALADSAFALNLFDRAAQEHRPGEIASVFRDIVSVDVAVEDVGSARDLQDLLGAGSRPETSSVSLGQAWQLLRDAKGEASVISSVDGELQISRAQYIQPGDTLVVPSSIAYLHRRKGLCLATDAEASRPNDAVLSSEWHDYTTVQRSLTRENGRRQTLLEHTTAVMDRTYEKLTSDGAYLQTLTGVLRCLEPELDPEQLTEIIAQLAKLAAGFHDLGKADQRWQARARQIDPDCPGDLIGRTKDTRGRMGIPHTPPSYNAVIKACELLMGPLGAYESLVRAVSLAAARHHSSLLNPADVQHRFAPSIQTIEFIGSVLNSIGATDSVISQAQDILAAAETTTLEGDVPLLLPNHDLFPIYVLVGRAILLADREDAAGKELETWRCVG